MIDEFVCVRLVKANDLDLTLFQFDFDLTFAVVFMNADKTVYGRYGSRSSIDNADKNMSLTGLADSMSAALKLHRHYPANKQQLAGKQPVETEFRAPRDFPSLQGKFKETLDYDGSVAKSCMHCHQIRDAHRQVYRDQGKPIPDRLLLPNPEPEVIGITMDSGSAADVLRVASGSVAAIAGIQPGDKILMMDGQAILSRADIQWVLHHAAPSQELPVMIQRGDQKLRRIMVLGDDWRRNADISWRVSSWALRRMVTGGLLLESASSQQRSEAGVDPRSLALIVKHVGQYGAHAAAKRAGFKKGDMVVSFDGQAAAMTSSQLLAYAAQNTRAGQQIPVIVIRAGKRHELTLPMQK